MWSVSALPGNQEFVGTASANTAATGSYAVTAGQTTRKLANVADVATGSADCMIRVFTPEPERALRGDELVEAQEALVVAAPEGGNGDGCSASQGLLSGGGGISGRLPPVSEMTVMVGERDGQLSAFVDDESGVAKVNSIPARDLSGFQATSLMGRDPPLSFFVFFRVVDHLTAFCHPPS